MAAGMRAGRPQPLSADNQTRPHHPAPAAVLVFALDAAQSQFAVADNDTASVIELTSTSDTPAREISPRHSCRSQPVTGRSQTQTPRRAVSAVARLEKDDSVPAARAE
jgi:hypothetical protein